MAVANKQIDELVKVISYYIPEEQMHGLMCDLRFTSAYKKNKSFHDTIDRIIKELDYRKAIDKIILNLSDPKKEFKHGQKRT